MQTKSIIISAILALSTFTAAGPQGGASTPTFYYRMMDPLPNDRCPNVQRANVEFKDAYTSCGKLLKDVGKYGVAIKDGGSHCGSKISVRSDSGKEIELTVVDTCPGCAGDNHLDMSLDALVELFDGDATKACGIDRTVPPVTWTFK